MSADDDYLDDLEEDDDDDLVGGDAGEAAAPKKTKRGGAFTAEEDMVITKSHMAATEDGVNGTDMTGAMFEVCWRKLHELHELLSPLFVPHPSFLPPFNMDRTLTTKSISN